MGFDVPVYDPNVRNAPAKPSRRERDVQKHEKRVAREKQQAAAERRESAEWTATRKAIYKRDQGKSRFSGKALFLRHDDPRLVGEVNHTQLRSRGGPDESWNLALLTPDEHDMFHHRHPKYVLDISGNADRVLTFVQKHRETGRIALTVNSPNPSLPKEHD